jgi:hypothetical protein
MAKSKSELTNEALRILTSGGKLTDAQKKLLGISITTPTVDPFASVTGSITGDPLGGSSGNTTVPSMTTWIVNLLKNEPELLDIYNAVRNKDGSFNTTAAAIVDMITSSSWYLKNGPTVAANVASRYRYGEPYYQQKVNEFKISVSSLATQIGLDVKDPTVAEYLESLAETAFLNQWDETYIENKIIDDDAIVGKINGGAYATAVDELAEYGNLMGFTLSDTTRKDYQRRLIGEVTDGGLRARTTPEQIKKEIRDKQALLYPMFSDDFAVGRTLWDVTSSQRKVWAALLEKDEDDLDWDDPLWKNGQIFTMTDEKTGKIVARPAWDAEKLVKQDERWQYTENATRLYESYGTKMLNKFGMAAI